MRNHRELRERLRTVKSGKKPFGNWTCVRKGAWLSLNACAGPSTGLAVPETLKGGLA